VEQEPGFQCGGLALQDPNLHLKGASSLPQNQCVRLLSAAFWHPLDVLELVGNAANAMDKPVC